TAEGHAGGATGQFDPIGTGQNRTRRRGGVSGRDRLRPAGTGGGRRRGTAAGLTGAKGDRGPGYLAPNRPNHRNAGTTEGGEEGVDATDEGGNGVAVLRAVLGGMASRGVGRGVSRGGAGQAKRPRPMDALPTRGRRSDGRDDWARGSGGVTAPGARNRRAW